MADQLKLDLDPKKILQALNDVAEESKKLSAAIEDSLGKNAVQSIEKMDQAAEKGSGSISSRFRDLGKRIKEDLKTAFDVSKLAAGLKFGEQIAQGIKEVFNLERAFDRLNTRLQLTGKSFQDFKKNVGTAIASTGQKLEDVFPGLETAAAKGNVKSPEQLALIGKALGQVRAATNENTETLADSVIEILKTQGKKVNAENFQQTLDTLQGTRIAGSFKTAGEAAQAIQGITSGVSPEQLRKMGLDTRALGGLAAQASRAGEGGQDILQHILQMATQAGGKVLLNSIFGTNLFKGEKLDIGAFSKVNQNQFGKYSEQVLSSATGADQAGLSRFLNVMKEGMGDFKKVTQGADETAIQFKTATNNLASGLDKFKEKAKNASREIGEDLSTAANELLKGNFKGAFEAAKHGGNSLIENKGTLGAALGGSAAAAVLLGSGASSLLSKVPGIGKIAGGLAGGELAKAAGATPVYVVNASEIGGGGVAGAIGSVAEGATGIASKLGLFGLAGGGGLAAGSALANTEIGKKAFDTLTDSLFEALNVGGIKTAKENLAATEEQFKEKTGISHDDYTKMAETIGKHVSAAIIEANKNRPTQFSNPSRPIGAGGHL